MSIHAGIIQGFCLLSLIGLFGYIFKRYPLQMSIQNLVLASLFVLLSVVLNAVALMIPFFGVPSVKISFALLPLMVAGAVLSPSWAYLVGLITDLIGLLITPTGFPFLGFTLNHVLVATLPALWYQRKIKRKPQTIQRIINGCFIGLGVAAALYVVQMQSIQVDQSTMEITPIMKVSIVVFLILVVSLMMLILHYVRKKMSHEKANDLAQWMVVALGMELLISIVLTPFWLDVMYGIPWFISMFIRVVKACLMIPLNVFVGFSLLKIVKRVSF